LSVVEDLAELHLLGVGRVTVLGDGDGQDGLTAGDICVAGLEQAVDGLRRVAGIGGHTALLAWRREAAQRSLHIAPL